MPEKLIALILSFPTLARRSAEIHSIDDVFAIEQNRSNSTGTRWAAAFILFVWNGREFDLYRAWGNWDNDHRAAWKAWASDPWWC